MTDVHRLGHVGAREVDHDRERLFDRRHAQPLVPDGGQDGGGQGIVADANIDEARPHGIARRLERGRVAWRGREPGGDLGGHLAGLAAGPLRQGHRHRAGVVAELRVGCLANLLEKRGDLARVEGHHAVGREFF